MSDSGIAGLIDRNLEKIAQQARGLVLVAGIVALAVLALAVAVDDSTVRVISVGGFVVLMLVLTVLLYLTTRAGSEDAEQYEAVNGRWWQLVDDDEVPGLTVIAVSLSPLASRHRLSGSKYDPGGARIARWRSLAVAVMSTEPLEVFYYWEGDYTQRPQSASGIGFFYFPTGPEDGSGWFTTGRLKDATFERTSMVHLRPIAPADAEVLDRGGEEARRLISARYGELSQSLLTTPARG